MFQTEEFKPLAKVKYVIAVAAGKGGVGKSTLTVNLAYALEHLGYKVGVMDTDIYGPSIRKMMPETKNPSQEAAILYPALCDRIKIMSMAYFRKTGEATVVRAPIANNLITQFVENVEWGELDFLLIDFPPGTGDIQLTLAQKAHLTGALMITTPQEVAVMDVRKAMDMFFQVGIPVIGIVENMSYFQSSDTKEKLYLFGKDGGLKLATETGTPFLGHLPIDPLLSEFGDRGQSIFKSLEAKDLSLLFIDLANQLVQHVKMLKPESDNHLTSFDLVWKEMES